ncbi:MAG: hypothetical protein EOM67_03315 [Spirochaetia bacterium]|nr:hypothetical protein [Spirochaetia bacterium]
MIKAMSHQIEKAEECWIHLQDKGYVYLAGKPRSGKTLTAILVCEKTSDRIQNILVVTKINAIPGWTKFIEGYLIKKKYTVINYEKLGTATEHNSKWTYKLKVNPKDFDLVIIDESHNIGAFPKPSGRWRVIKKVCEELPHINLSGTAIVESPNSIFHQMCFSKYKPFYHDNFYKFFSEWGKPYCIQAAGRMIQQYDKYQPKLLDEIDQFTVYMTQEDAGISHDLQAQDQVHYVTLDEETKDVYNYLQKHLLVYVEGLPEPIVGDSTMKLRVSLHMVESGVAKIGEEYFLLGNTEKVDYIKNTFGDHEGLGIMCHFLGERKLLEKHFKKAKIYSSNAHSEGVDLSHLSSFVILSSDYSGAKFIQRRERIVNINGSNTLHVLHILVKNAISEQVYKKVSKKEDFNNETYKRTEV